MLRLAFKAIKHNPKRLILTSIAVILGVSFVTTIHTLTNTIDRQFSDMIEEIYSGADITVADPDALQFDEAVGNAFPESVLADVEAIPGVDLAVGQVGSSPVLLDASGEIPQQTGAPNLFFNWIDNEDIGRVSIVEGRAPLSNGEAAIDQSGMERLDYEIGDILQVATDDGLVDYEIVGASWFGETNDLSTAILVQLTLEDMQTLGGFEGQLQQISILVSDGYDIDAVAEEINAVLPTGFEAVSNADIIAEQTSEFREALRFVDIFTLVFALIAVFVGGFIIANTFRIIVTQRTREIGLVRALGARGSQVRSQILLEALIVAIASSIIGIGLGYLFAIGLSAALEAMSPGLMLGTPGLPVDAVIWGASVGLGVTLVAAMLPAVHASQISPMEALRESATMHRKPLGLRNAVGGSLVTASLVGIGLGLYADVPQPGIWVGASAAVMVLGVALLSAQLLTWLAHSLRRPLGSVFGVNSRLAVGNIQREPRRAGVTATALMIGVLLLALVATLTATLKVAVREQVKDQVACDFIVSGGDFVSAMSGQSKINVSEAAQEAILSTPDVTLVSVIQIGEGTLDGKTVYLGAIEPDTAEQTYHHATTPGVERLGGGAYVSQSILDLGYEVGDTITVVGADAPRDLTITGTNDTAENWDILVSVETAATLDDEMLTLLALVNIEPGADIPSTLVAIEDSLDQFPLLKVSQPDQVVKDINASFDSMLLFITVMLAASLLIAVLGVANTLFLSVTERTREIGLLRAVGVRRRSVRSMITLESVMIALFGALTGIALGVGLGAALVTSLQEYGFGSPVIPVMWLLIYTILAILAGIAAALVPARIASKLNILEAVTTE
ncbi:MAG: ABC transporter permease [Demequinaceae bacterium]|nr:ABC transporter permease [Demequinaceae bacterium]